MIPHDWLLANYPYAVTDEDFEYLALGNTDGDQMNTWEEYIAGTSPTNSTDEFIVSTTATSNEANVIEWTSVSNRLYSIYSHTNLLSDWSSTPVHQIQGDGDQKSYTNTLPGSPRYFRVGVELNH